MNIQVYQKLNKSSSLLYKDVILSNTKKKHLSYKSISKMYKHLLTEDYDPHMMSIQVLNDQQWFTIKGLDDDMFETLDDYYKNKVKNPSRFVNKFEKVSIRIYDK